MKLTSLHVTNFRGLGEAHLDNLPTICYVTGLNGQGKTSLLDAVRAAMFGNVYNAHGNGLKLARLIGPSASSATVQIGFGDLTATWKSSVRKSELDFQRAGMTVYPGSPAASREAFWKAQGVTRGDHAACAANAYATLATEELPGLLADFVTETIDLDRVTKWAGVHASWLGEFMAEHSLSPEKLADYTKVGKKAYESRTDRNKDLKELKDELAKVAQLPQPVSKDGRKLTIADLPDVEKAIAEMHEQLDTLHEEIGEERSGETRVSLDAASKELTDEVERLASAVREAQTCAESESTQNKCATNAVNDLTARRDTAKQEHYQIVKDCEVYQQFVRKVCPACKEALANEATPKVERQETLRETIEDLDAKIKEAADQREYTERQLTVSQKRTAERQAELKATQMRLGDAQKKLAKYDANPHRPLADVEAEIADKESRIENGRSLVKALEAQKNLQSLHDRIKKVETDQGHLQWAVEAFEKGAFQREVLGGSDALTEWTDRCNKTMNPFGLTLRVDDGVAMLSKDGKVWVPFLECSDGERTLAQAAVASAFSDHAIVILDEVNSLDHLNRGPLVELMGQSENSVFIAGAYVNPTNLSELAAAIAPIGLVWVENGVAQLVQP